MFFCSSYLRVKILCNTAEQEELSGISNLNHYLFIDIASLQHSAVLWGLKNIYGEKTENMLKRWETVK